METLTVRVRSLVWFSIGVVTTLVAVLVVAVEWPASAAPDDGSATYVPVEPCRLFDYRPAPLTVGKRNVPLSPGETTVQQVTGQVGDCSLPAGATAVAMNVTITEPTAASHLTVFPADVATVPTVSSLNWVAGQAPTPNKVDVQLSSTGRIKLYNLFGQVYVLADVVGYYVTTALDDIRAELADRHHPISLGGETVPEDHEVRSEWSFIHSAQARLQARWEGAQLGSANFTLSVPGDFETIECRYAPTTTPPSDSLRPGDYYGGENWAAQRSPEGGFVGQMTIMGTSWITTGAEPIDVVWTLYCRNVDGGTATITNVHTSLVTGDLGSVHGGR